jgi:hypothetical protein
MRKKTFFKNLGNVAVFGLCVTIVCFVIYSVANIGLIALKPTMTNFYYLNNGIEEPNG